ncbi:MAG: alpha-L-fucosidase [Kiritimatiellae bacterium]|nr:alpha-L-fucosidase [Kiritimatiellia bacterium]
MKFKSAAVGFLLAGALPGFSMPVHTDGIEPYYHPESLQYYLDTLPEGDRSALFASAEDMEWWTDARFGLFYCWGPASMLECSLGWGRKGPRPQHPTDGKVTKGIPQEIYDNQYKQLEAPNFDADELVSTVKDAGAKYLIWLTKHHDGFSVFDTKLTDYNIMNTPFGRDATREVVDACHKYGIKVALYYSQPDWYNPIYTSGDNERYCDEYLSPQIRELLTQYGKIDVMWFDGLGRHPDTWKAPKLLKMIRELQPGIIVNHRFGHPPWHMGDFDGPERTVGRFQTNRPWETCTVIGGGWAWSGDAPAMPLPQAISLLVRCAGGGGNLALGVGPRGTGELVPDHKKRLGEIGKWMKQYGDTVYRTQGGPYIPGIWGASTHEDKTVYLHVLASWNGVLVLPALPAEIQSMKVLTGGDAEFSQTPDSLIITLDPSQISPVNTLIKLTLDRPASEIAPIQTKGEPLSLGAIATASSSHRKENRPQNVVASDAKEFSEGIFVKSSWGPSSRDKQPWIQLQLSDAESVSQIRLMEGRFGSGSRVQKYELQAEIGGQWVTVHTDTTIGGDCNILLKEPVESDIFRLHILKWDGHMNLNSFELY